MVGKKFVPYVTPTPELRQYTGTFYSDELQTIYTIEVKDAKLVIHHFRRGDFELSSNMKDEFTGDIGTIDFFRNNSTHISGFMLSGENIRNIHFRKQ